MTTPIRIGDEWIACGFEGHPPYHAHRHPHTDLLSGIVWAVWLNHLSATKR